MVNVVLRLVSLAAMVGLFVGGVWLLRRIAWKYWEPIIREDIDDPEQVEE